MDYDGSIGGTDNKSNAGQPATLSFNADGIMPAVQLKGISKKPLLNFYTNE